jgi:hypothetical protein
MGKSIIREEKKESNLVTCVQLKLNSRCLHDAQVRHVAGLQQHLPELHVLVPGRRGAGQTQLLVHGAEVHVHHVGRRPEALIDWRRELCGAEALGLLRLDGDLARAGGGRGGLRRRGARHAAADAARPPQRRCRVTLHVGGCLPGGFAFARLFLPAAAVSVLQPLLEVGVPHVLDLVVGAPRQLCGDRGPPVDT